MMHQAYRCQADTTNAAPSGNWLQPAMTREAIATFAK